MVRPAVHSDLTAVRPRRKKRFAPRFALICPKTGSIVVDIYVGFLRQKLGPTSIETVRGMGYRLVV